MITLAWGVGKSFGEKWGHFPAVTQIAKISSVTADSVVEHRATSTGRKRHACLRPSGAIHIATLGIEKRSTQPFDLPNSRPPQAALVPGAAS
jgi:hypothetical protein